MAKWTVDVTFMGQFTVEAETEDEAEELAISEAVDDMNQLSEEAVAYLEDEDEEEDDDGEEE